MIIGIIFKYEVLSVNICVFILYNLLYDEKKYINEKSIKRVEVKNNK